MASKPDFTKPCNKSETKKCLRQQLVSAQEQLAKKMAAGDARGVEKINGKIGYYYEKLQNDKAVRPHRS